MAALELYIPGPRHELAFWSGADGEWRYDGPCTLKRPMVAAAASLHLAPTGEPERVVEVTPAALALRLAADSLRLTLPPGTDPNAVRGVWVVLEPPKDPRKR